MRGPCDVRFVALAADFDGTLAIDGVLDEPTASALVRLRRSGRELILVTGREIPDLAATCSDLDLFSLVVAENGAVLYWPVEDRYRLLAEPPPPALVAALRDQGIEPLSVGRSIVATWHPHEVAALATIQSLGLEHQLIFNKGAVMILPPGINKATGLKAALEELRLSPHNVVGIGDAENDHSFLHVCECAVAVENALPMLKQRADFVTTRDHGAGVIELIDEMLANDLIDRDPLLHRHRIPLGTRADGQLATLPSQGSILLVVGPPTSGKSTLALGLMERLTDRGHQLCVIDPEGDYEAFGEARVEVRRAAQATTWVAELMESPQRSVCVDLLGVSMLDRPRFGIDLLDSFATLSTQKSRPHWLVLDKCTTSSPSSRAVLNAGRLVSSSSPPMSRACRRPSFHGWTSWLRRETARTRRSVRTLGRSANRLREWRRRTSGGARHWSACEPPTIRRSWSPCSRPAPGIAAIAANTISATWGMAAAFLFGPRKVVR